MQHTTSTTTTRIEDRSIAKAVQIAQEEQESRARLRDGAPELLEALKAFIVAWDKSLQLEKTDVALKLARAAIAKAEGKG